MASKIALRCKIHSLTSQTNSLRIPRRPLIHRRIQATPEESTQATLPEYTLTIKKPLGMILAERKDDSGYAVFVEEIIPEGNAAATGQIQVGDVVTKTSAIVLKSGKDGEYEREGYGQRVYDNWETIEFDCKDQTFDTVMAAIGSNNERWGIMKITLTLARQKE